MKNFLLLFFLFFFGIFFSEKIFAISADFNQIFPTEKGKIYEKLAGKNLTGEKDILDFLPNVINILLKIVAPLIFGMFVFAGFRFIYAGNDDEQLKKSKEFFLYGVIGLIFILTSFSLMKIIYFLFV